MPAQGQELIVQDPKGRPLFTEGQGLVKQQTDRCILLGVDLTYPSVMGWVASLNVVVSLGARTTRCCQIHLRVASLCA